MKTIIRYSMFKDAGAEFSDCGEYRFRLWRCLAGQPLWTNTINFLMLNPSTATHEQVDPTVARCIERANRMGFSEIVVTNLFALRSTDPAALRKHREPTGGEANDRAIVETAVRSSLVVCAWGNDGALLKRAKHVMGLLAKANVAATCLKLTGKNQPYHPLYVGYANQPQPFGLQTSTE